MAATSTPMKKQEDARWHARTDGGKTTPPAGSAGEHAVTARTVGFPGAFTVTCSSIQREVWSRLDWEC